MCPPRAIRFAETFASDRFGVNLPVGFRRLGPRAVGIPAGARRGERDGSVVGTPRVGGTPAWAMAWSPDARALATGDENGSITVVGPSGTQIGSDQLNGDVNELAFSPDGGFLAAGENDRVTVVQAAHPHLLAWSNAADGSELLWAMDGRSLLYESGGGLVLASADGTTSRSFVGCGGRIRQFAWAGESVIAVTDAGQICS